MPALAASPSPNALSRAFDHEQLELFRDPETGLIGAVAIHSTALGPSMGGLRIRSYPDLEAAAVDALRLAKAMTLKSAAAGLHIGGGKAVLIDDGRWGEDRKARLLAFGDVVQRLGGRYVTAEDVGTSPSDMDLIATRTRWVVGRSPQNGGSGDPSGSTALTVLGAIEAAARLQLGARSLRGVSVGVLGAGKVGAALVRLLVEAGALVTVADIDAALAARTCGELPHVQVAPIEGFLGRELDVLSPCAMGELIGLGEVPKLRCRILAGAANNPLADRETALALHRAGILYVPDFVANCGGIVHVAGELEGLAPEAVAAQLTACVARTGELLAKARDRQAPPIDVAVEQALARVQAARAG